MIKPHSGILAMLIFSVALAAPAFAQQNDLPAVHKAGDVEYLSGGVGSSELAAVKKAAPQWPLALEFAAKDETGVAAYVANVQVVISDAAKKPVLSATANGPFMLVRLAPGRYSIEATQEGKTLTKAVTVTAGHPTKLVVIWP
jgi:hypothetical protein